ncbi:MAG: VWA domain-containing protein [Bacteroidia bacterium]|nr:VWA domain-containing protein [Bacteroidia bacterium]
MSLLTRIEEELSGFVHFGGMMTEKLRRETSEMVIMYLYDPDYDANKRLEESQIPFRYPNWYGLLQRLFGYKELRNITRNNEDLTFSIAKDTLAWARRVARQFEANPEHFEEEVELKYILENTRAVKKKRWQQILLNLKERYPAHGRSWDFYRESLSEIFSRMETETHEDIRQRINQDMDVLQKNILEDWNNYFYNKKHALEESFLDNSFSRYASELIRKVTQLNDLGDLLSPFYNFLGHVWSDSLGAWERVDWDKLEEYAKSLQRDPQLRELAELLGRWKNAEKQMENQKLQQPVPERAWKPNPYGKSEIIGIHHSDDLSAMLPSEIALLSSPETEIILSKKFVEKKLLTFQYRSDNISTSPKNKEEITQIADSNQRGPMIICIDTSGSMFGAPERIAKALALAILEIALKQKRKAYLISFSTGIKTIEMTGLEQNLDQMIDFLRMSFHGGTDIQPALEETIKMLGNALFGKADVLIISDFVIPRIERKLYEDVLRLRSENKTNFHSLYITRRHDPRVPPLPIFDNHWVYDLENPKVMRQMVDHFEVFLEEE